MIVSQAVKIERDSVKNKILRILIDIYNLYYIKDRLYISLFIY